jgi:hypothetical protein
MNPNRDAVSVGYLTRVHRTALPILLDEMDASEGIADWVGSAAAGSAEEVQKAVVQTAFGDKAVRSVPAMGKYSPDDDARESVGASIVNVRHLSRGFKDLALRHIQTSREVVAAHYKHLAEQRSIDADKPDAIDQDAVLRGYVKAIGGMQRVQRVCAFAKWFCDSILERLQEPNRCKLRFGVLEGADATWTDNGAVLSLSVTYTAMWQKPLSRYGLRLLIHEVAHERAAHHGLSYTQAMEEVAGIAAELVLGEHDFITSTFGDLT